MDTIEGIIKFNKDRGLTDFNAPAEFAMLQEELQEFYVAYANEDTHEIVDALCDLIVIATGGIHKLGYDPVEALLETVREITSRKGSFDPATGKWQKDKQQDPKTLYKANYSRAAY